MAVHIPCQPLRLGSLRAACLRALCLAALFLTAAGLPLVATPLIAQDGSPAEAAQTGTQPAPAPTTWTNDKGVPIEAEFVRMTDAGVVLRLSRDGREAAVPLTKLSIESIYQAVRLENPQAFSKPVPKAVVKPQGPKLPELQLTVDEVLQDPFKDGTTIEQYFELCERLPREGNYFSQWYMLPPKMQTDIEDLIVEGHRLMGPAVIKQIETLLGDLKAITGQKKKFVLGLPDVENNPQLVTTIDELWPLANNVVSVLAQGERWQPSNFEKNNVRRWMAQLSLDLAPSLIAASEPANESLGLLAWLPLEPPKHTIVSQTADSAEVEVKYGDSPAVKKQFQRIGNIWIDVQAMNELRVKVDDAKKQLAEDGEKAVGAIRSGLSGLVASQGGLARAETQEGFTQAFTLLRTYATSTAQSLGFTLPTSNRGPSDSSSNPYGSSSSGYSSGSVESGGGSVQSGGGSVQSGGGSVQSGGK